MFALLRTDLCMNIVKHRSLLQLTMEQDHASNGAHRTNRKPQALSYLAKLTGSIWCLSAWMQ